MSKREKVIVEAKSLMDATNTFMASHPDEGDYAWACNVNRTDRPGFYEITQWKVKVR